MNDISTRGTGSFLADVNLRDKLHSEFTFDQKALVKCISKSSIKCQCQLSTNKPPKTLNTLR